MQGQQLKQFPTSLPVKHGPIICRPKGKDNWSVLCVCEETLQVPHKTKMVRLAHTLHHLGGRTFQLWRQLRSKECWLFFPNPPVHHSISSRKCLYKTTFIWTPLPFSFKHAASPVGARCEELCFKVKELSENFIYLLSCTNAAELWSPSYHHCPGSKATPALFRLPDAWSRKRDWMGFRKAWYILISEKSVLEAMEDWILHQRTSSTFSSGSKTGKWQSRTESFHFPRNYREQYLTASTCAWCKFQSCR